MTLPTLIKSSTTTNYVQQKLPTSDINVLCTNQQKTSSSSSASLFVDFNQLVVENIMPGIYFTKNFTVWTEDKLSSHGFTHVIIIDKHIQNFYNSSNENDTTNIFKLQQNAIKTTISSIDDYDIPHHHNYSISKIEIENNQKNSTALNFSKEFDVIDLNFGEKSYLTTVLPNCYKAVKFINKALQCGGTILIIDCNGSKQKCLTITIAFLMYKNNLSFCDAFNQLKTFYKKADLDKFYISQLYEYEPILQVQRAQSRGHSCSREMYAAILKRKKLSDDCYYNGISNIDNINMNNNSYNYNSNSNYNNNNNDCNINSKTNVNVLNETPFHHSPYKAPRCSYTTTINDDFPME